MGPSLSPAEVQARREGEISLTTNYRTDGDLLKVMNEWWEDLFAERHRFFPDADYYATPQRLQASPDKMSRSGAIDGCRSEMMEEKIHPRTVHTLIHSDRVSRTHPSVRL